MKQSNSKRAQMKRGATIDVSLVDKSSFLSIPVSNTNPRKTFISGTLNIESLDLNKEMM